MCVKNTWVLYTTPCLIVYTFNGIKKAINVYFVCVARRLNGVERLKHPFLEFKETI